MTLRRREAGRLMSVLVASCAAAVMPGWWSRGSSPVPFVSMMSAVAPATSSPGLVDPPLPLAQSTPAPAIGGAGATSRDSDEAAIAALRNHRLRVPIDNAEVERLKGMFGESRNGNPAHEAVDILAPRDTPIHAVDDGTIAKLFTSNTGGLTIYQFDPDQRFCFYYAHLERYASGLGEGQRVTRGEVIGFVGTSGNAPANTPHLHFAIFELGPDHRWWSGRPIDPYLVLK
jgi:peptidoglycan LD-endopeptidase LytH